MLPFQFNTQRNVNGTNYATTTTTTTSTTTQNVKPTNPTTIDNKSSGGAGDDDAAAADAAELISLNIATTRIARVPPNNTRLIQARIQRHIKYGGRNIDEDSDDYDDFLKEQYVSDASLVPLKPKPENLDVYDKDGFLDLFLSRLKVDLIRMTALSGRTVKPKDGRYELLKNEDYRADEHFAEMERFSLNHLNAGQHAIWQYVKDNPNHIVLIQAGPGCGKSFVLKTIAFNHPTHMCETIIYKNDLLYSYKYNTRRFSVASFVMKILNIRFYDYRALDKHLSSRMSTYDFMLSMIGMLKRATMLDFKNSIVYLDEYSIVPKPLLVLILVLLEFYGVGVVICGDKNQLQNIHNSSHALMSAYGLAQTMCHKEFTLTSNERCSDNVYNDLVDYFRQFSSSSNLTEQAYAALAALFPQQCLEPATYHQIHLAACHQDLATLMHILVMNNRYETKFYYINQTTVRSVQSPCLLLPGAAQQYCERVNANQPPFVDKFVPYIPLVIGGRYFVNIHSEHSQGTLQSINNDQSLTMLMDNGQTENVRMGDAGPVTFEMHREHLMDGLPGKLFNYPVYPANFMTIHKCQGCTIAGDLDLILTNCTFQHLYVALSRVTSRSQISRILIPNQMRYLVSAIINFPQLCFSDNIPINDVARELANNYTIYDVKDVHTFSRGIGDFFRTHDPELRKVIRREIIKHASSYASNLVKPVAEKPESEPNNLAIYKIIKLRKLFIALSRLRTMDRNVWLHEFMHRCPENATEFQFFLQADKEYCGSFENKKYIDDHQPVINYGDGNDFNLERHETVLSKLAELHNAPLQSDSCAKYIEHNGIRNIRFNEEIAANAHVCLKSLGDNVYLESSEFCCKVYKLYEQGRQRSDLTLSWLMDELNLMLEKTQGAMEGTPEKNFNAKKRTAFEPKIDILKRKTPGSTPTIIKKRVV